jgi:phosphoribosylformylglycinamidine synthase I
MKTKIAVIVFPGSNCDHDAYYVLNKVFGVDVGFVWHKETNLDDYDAVLIPGGFSYGDYLRTGAIARFSPIMESVIQSSKNGKPIIGICNGFQILLECGLLPGALINNSEIKFLSKSVTLEVVSKKSIFSNKLDIGEKMKMPIAHRQGNYIADKGVLNDLTDQDRIIFKYKKNPNGSMLDIAGICNEKGNVLGMMPHPERACENILGSIDGRRIFESMLGSM